MLTRRLTLSRETLTQLTSDELTAVHGGAVSGECTTILTFLTCDVTCFTEA
ncbi:MAG TPA: class I lanthipeptide [Mycobacteriales bacterium]